MGRWAPPSKTVSEGHAVVGAHWSLLVDNTEAKVLEAHESGVELIAWTVDDPDLDRSSPLGSAGSSPTIPSLS